MKKVNLYQVDAFSNKLYHGNPAAVVVLENWIADELMKNIAAENNLSETAFVVNKGEYFEIRWFTPLVEVELCGHATLASAYVIFNELGFSKNIINFHSRKRGILIVEKVGEQMVLDFPADTINKIEIPQLLKEAFNYQPLEAYKGKTDYLLLFNNQKEIETLVPNFAKIAESKVRGVMVTARGNDTDFVSRFFAPFVGINEDPVTGSAHTTLIPFWAERLGKTDMIAKQLSKRVGDLSCKLVGDRVKIGGNAVLYLIGQINI